MSTKNTSKNRLLTIKEAAKIFDGLTEYRIRQMCLTNQLPSFKAGSKTLIYEENLYKVVTGSAEQTDSGKYRKRH